jgi:putative oxidoreductase
MSLGRFLLRITVGGTFVVHGTQKLFGWFGGNGPEGTGQFFESVGLRPGHRNAVLAGATEAGCGVMLAAGIATPAAAAGLSGVMITALRTVIWKDGVKPGTGEFEALLAAAALAVADEDSGPGWALAALGAGAAG